MKDDNIARNWSLWTLWILLIHLSGLYLFTTGFFLTRFEVNNLSSCDEIPYPSKKIGNFRNVPRESFDKNKCWYPKKFDRVVLVIIDALRYDFAKYDHTLSNDTAAFYYLNNLRIVDKLLQSKPLQSFLWKFQADPPTLTMQRLKGLTTGNLPTFLDFKDNLHSTEIIEDSIIKQMYLNKKNIVFMGDNTWDSLYSTYFLRKYLYDSFNVKDLDTVDNGVIQNLFPELKKKDWSLLIAHFLGVDHVGHTYGPSNMHMKTKLQQMNGVLERLVDYLDNDTLLVVMGDHGMSWDGNHGGATDDETGAALFLYSNQLIQMDLNSSFPQWKEGSFHQYGHSTTTSQYNENLSFQNQMESRQPSYDLNQIGEIPQVDLVPSLSLLLGLPIPFGNLGQVIPNLFFTQDKTLPSSTGNHIIESFKNLNQALYVNAQQVRRYFETYINIASIPTSSYVDITKDYQHLMREWELLQQLSTSSYSTQQLIQKEATMTKILQTYLKDLLALGRSIWTQFDLTRMYWGILILSMGCFAILLLFFMETLDIWIIVYGYAFGILLFSLPLHRAMDLLPMCNIARAILLPTLSSLVWFMIISLRKLRDVLPTITIEYPYITCSSILTVGFHSLALLSNSYIISEDHVFLFLTATQTILVYMECLKCNASLRVATIGTLLSLIAGRWGKYFPPNVINTTVTPHLTLIPMAICGGMLLFSRFSLNKNMILNHDKLQNKDTKLLTEEPQLLDTKLLKEESQLLPKTGLILRKEDFSVLNKSNVLLVCSTLMILIHWTFNPSSSTVIRLWLPRIVFLLTLFGQGFLYRTTCSLVYTIPLQVSLMATSFVLVLGPQSPSIVLSLVIQFGVTLINLNNITTANNGKSISLVSLSLLWTVYMNSSYYMTGHHNYFTSLQNAAGFVGFDEFSFYIAGTLLGYNTWGSQIIAIFASPLLSIYSKGTFQMKDFRTLSCTILGYYSWNLVITTVFVAIQRRHLMVWAIFAPKFIFDGTTFLVIAITILLYSSLVTFRKLRQNAIM